MNLASSLVDPEGAHITVEPLNTRPLDVSGTAKDLHCPISNTTAHLSGKVLTKTNIHCDIITAVALSGGSRIRALAASISTLHSASIAWTN